MYIFMSGQYILDKLLGFREIILVHTWIYTLYTYIHIFTICSYFMQICSRIKFINSFNYFCVIKTSTTINSQAQIEIGLTISVWFGINILIISKINLKISTIYKPKVRFPLHNFDGLIAIRKM